MGAGAAGSLLCLLATLFFVGPSRRWREWIGALGLALSIGGIGFDSVAVRSWSAICNWSVGDGIGFLQQCGKNIMVLETLVARVLGM